MQSFLTYTSETNQGRPSTSNRLRHVLLVRTQRLDIREKATEALTTHKRKLLKRFPTELYTAGSHLSVAADEGDVTSDKGTSRRHGQQVLHESEFTISIAQALLKPERNTMICTTFSGADSKHLKSQSRPFEKVRSYHSCHTNGRPALRASSLLSRRRASRLHHKI